MADCAPRATASIAHPVPPLVPCLTHTNRRDAPPSYALSNPQYPSEAYFSAAPKLIRPQIDGP